MFFKNYSFGFFMVVACLIISGPVQSQNVPIGFIDQVHSTNWNAVTGFEFDNNNNMYVYDKKGRVWIVDSNGVQLSTPMLDLSDEVGNFGDNGLLGFCLHPNFLNNGYIYLFYTVDRYNLLYAGTPGYDSTQSMLNEATICRLTRYQADASNNFHSVIPSSRTILLGENKTNGVPLLFIGHSGGQIRFGNDTSLFITTGDGASYGALDSGSTTGTYWYQALQDSIIRPAENVGAFRSQMMGSLAGKLLRLDPMTGKGLPTNPYYTPSNPDSIVSKIWALGFRNPFRFNVMPNTGSTDITAGNPGVIFVGDVGWNTWESLDIISTPGLNFGWPVYEGLTEEPQYGATEIRNMDAPNPLYGTLGCTNQYFKFEELVVLDRNFGNPLIKNPCDTTQIIPANCYPMVHKRAALEWRHNQNTTRAPIYNTQGNPLSANISQPISPVQGAEFAGNASVGGVYYNDNRYPLLYQNCYYHGDYGVGWIKRFTLDSAWNILTVDSFASGLGPIVFLNINPKTGCIMYVKYPNEIHSICYSANINNPPKAVALADTIYTPNNSLTVQFDGSQSTDPENIPLQYEWNFGDGSPHDFTAAPQHTYTTISGFPVFFNVTLTVTDDTLQTSVDALRIHLRNTPPVVNITSPTPGYMYPIHILSILPETANVTDAQTADPQLHYEWQLEMHHNIHVHPEPVDTNHSTQVIITPIGCDTAALIFFRVNLTVSDPQGLKGFDSQDIFADCASGINDFMMGNESLSTLVFPNPVSSGSFFVIVKSKVATRQNLQLSIFDLTGRMLMENSYPGALQTGEIVVPVNLNLTHGMYVLRAYDGKHICYFKFNVQ